jgi:tetratricopeptide (TPR) repeat protein
MLQAIELNPSFAAAYAILGHILAYAGRSEETIPLVEKAIRLSPNDPRLFIWLPALACAHYQLQHYHEAVEAGRRAWTLNRNLPVGLRYVVAGLAQRGPRSPISSRSTQALPPSNAWRGACSRTQPRSITSSTACERPASNSSDSGNQISWSGCYWR